MGSIQNFTHVCFIDLETKNGKITQYSPHLQYNNKNNHKLHKYGLGPFCKFQIPKGYEGKKGVYLMVIDKNIRYIGKCIDLQKRFNMGYGNISPRNCYVGGQSTNCKINALILNKIKNKSVIELKFLETENYSKVEKSLILNLNPQWNDQFTRKV